MKFSVALILLLLCGCSSFTYTRAGYPYDGSGHAFSSVLCARYHASHDSSGDKLKGSAVGDTIFLAGFGVVDLVGTFILDTLRLPVDVFRDKVERPKWDGVNHWHVGNCKEYDVFFNHLP